MTRPLRVLHIITRLIVGGAQENTLDSAALLDPQRYTVNVISGPQTGAEGSLIDEAYRRGIALKILPSLRREISPLNDLRALAALTGILRRGHYDLVHTHSSKAGILGRTAARLAGVPRVVHTVHGWSFHNYMHPVLRRGYIMLERRMARFTDALIVVAERDREKGLAEGIGRPTKDRETEKYHLIRSAISLEAFNPAVTDRHSTRRALGLPPDAPVVGNIGRFSPQKDPLEWARAAGRIARINPDARFLLVGDGPLRGAVQSALAAEGLARRCILTGLRRDTPQLLAAMDVFLLTSLWEGLPRVIPQAMAMGLPVVAVRADGTAEAVLHGESGYLCDPGDTGSLAGRCLELLADAELRARMGAEGKRLAAVEFDLRTMIAQIDALYSELFDLQIN